MLRQWRVALCVVAVLGSAAAPAWAGLIQSGLIFCADAKTDNNGADGWTFTQPAVSGSPSDALQPKDTAPTWTNAGGVQMFATTNSSQSFAADSARIAGADTKDFTFQIGLIRYTAFNTATESQIACWRADPDFSNNFCNLYMPSGSQVTLDYKDRAGTRTNHIIADIGHDTYHLLTVTYKDSTGPGANNGQLTAYLDGTQTFQSNTEPLYMAGSGTAFFQYMAAFVSNVNENYRNFDGGMLFVNLYNKVLSSGELAQNLYEFDTRIGLVPEPGGLILGVTGLMGLMAYAWRKRR